MESAQALRAPSIRVFGEWVGDHKSQPASMNSVPGQAQVLVCVPAGADTDGDLQGRKSGFPNWPSDNPKAMETALYSDPVKFASRIKAPAMAGMGFIDTVSPPAEIWTALNQIPGPTEPVPLIELEHGNLTPDKGRDCPARTQQILDSLRVGAKYNPTVLK